MAVAVKGTPTSAATTSVALPTHAVGDLIVIYAYRNGSTAIATKPAASGTVPAWVTIDGPTGANTNSLIVCQFVATASNHTSGTWANATNMAAIVLTGQSPAVIGGHAQGGGATTTSPSSPTVTLTDADGSSLLLYMWAANAETAWGTQPTGFTDQLADNTAHIAISTKNSSTASGAQTRTTTTTSTYRSETVEIVSGPNPTDATTTSESFGVAGPIIYSPVNTAESVTVSITGGITTLSINVSDSTTTTNTPTVAPLLIPGVSVADSTTTTSTGVTVQIPAVGTLAASVSDSTTTHEAVTVSLPGGGTTLNVTASDSTTTTETLGFADPIIYEPINTFESVSVQVGGGGGLTPLSATGSDSTTTAEWIVIAFDPPIIFTLEVDVADTVTTSSTGSTVSITGGTSTLSVNVADSITTTSTNATVAPLAFPGINVTDNATTNSTSVTVQILASGTLSVNVQDTITTTNTSTVTLPTALHVAVTDSTSVGNVPSVRIAGEGLPHDYDLPITMAVESITRGLAVDNPHSIAVQTNTRGLAVETISRTLAVDEPHSIAVQPNIKELAVDGP